MRQRPEGFLRGALVLTVTGLIVKLMGALYNPAIVRIFARFDGHEGNLGKALVGIPAVTYLIISSFSSNGFNIAVSRLAPHPHAPPPPRPPRRIKKTKPPPTHV